jgi:hypothetical protein
MKPLLLLDVDGVLIRDKPLLNHVKDNVSRYVQHKLPGVQNPARVNRILYRQYGHTGRGLFDAFGIDTRDFTKTVYDKKLMSHLWEVLSSNDFQLDAMNIHEMCQEYEVRLFSNSPLVWTLPIASAISDCITVSPQSFFLKPDPRAYVKFPHNRVKYFVDDSVPNLRTANYLYNWKCIHFGLSGTKEFPSVQSIPALEFFLSSVKK